MPKFILVYSKNIFLATISKWQMYIIVFFCAIGRRIVARSRSFGRVGCVCVCAGPFVRCDVFLLCRNEGAENGHKKQACAIWIKIGKRWRRDNFCTVAQHSTRRPATACHYAKMNSSTGGCVQNHICRERENCEWPKPKVIVPLHCVCRGLWKIGIFLGGRSEKFFLRLYNNKMFGCESRRLIKLLLPISCLSVCCCCFFFALPCLSPLTRSGRAARVRPK